MSQVLQQIDILDEKRHSRNRNVRKEYEDILEDINSFPSAWFACLMYFPLFTKPVIVAMIREWLEHCLEDQALERVLSSSVKSGCRRLPGK